MGRRSVAILKPRINFDEVDYGRKSGRDSLLDNQLADWIQNRHPNSKSGIKPIDPLGHGAVAPDSV